MAAADEPAATAKARDPDFYAGYTRFEIELEVCIPLRHIYIILIPPNHE